MTNHDDESNSSIESTQEIPAEHTYLQRIDPGRQNNDRYHLLRAHATGGLGRISVAVDQKFGRTVAYKEIAGARADSDKAMDLFLKEAEVTAQLEHPGIVPIYDVGQRQDGTPYYSMRFIEGESLRAAISRVHGAGARQSAVWWYRSLRPLIQRLVEVCNAIQYAHSRGVLHRDIKPDNIMLGRFGETLIVDWGLAKRLQVSDPRDVTESDVVGTIGYMSPEQATSPEDVSTATDVFSLGATLFAVLAGKPSSRQSSMAGLIEEMKSGQIACPSSINPKAPKPLAAICRKAMNLQPEDRYASVTEFSQELQRWMDREDVLAYREPMTERISRWVGRRKVTATAVVGLLLAGVIGLSVAGYSSLQRQQQAEKNLFQVLKTTQKFFDDTQDYLTDVPALTNLRLQLLQESAAIHEDVLKRNPDNPTVIYRTSNIHSKLSQIYERLEREGERAVAHARSTELGQDLFRFGDQHLTPDYRQRTARWWYYLTKAVAIKVAGRRNDDIQSVIASVEALRKEIAADELLSDEHRRDFEGSLASYVGQAYVDLNDFDAAIPHFQAAEEIMKTVDNLNPVALFDNQSDYGIALQGQGKLIEAIDVWNPLIDACRQGLLEKPDGVKQKTWRQNLADGLWLRARAQMAVGRGAEAIAGCQESLAIHRQLATEYPGLPSHSSSAAGLELDLAIVYCQTGRIPDSLPHYDRAIADLQLLSRRYPDSDSYRTRLAGAHFNKATAAYQSQKFPEALVGFREALEINQRISDDSDTQQAQYQVAISHLGYAAALTRSEREYSEVKPHYDQAFSILEKLVKESPQEIVYRRKLGLAIRNFGDLLSRQLDPIADQYLIRAEKLYAQIAKQADDDLQLRFQMAQTFDGRGRIATRFGRLQLSNELLHKALEEFDPLWEDGQRMDNLNLKVVKIRRLIADNHKDLQQWDQARKSYADALQMADRVLQVDEDPLYAERLMIQHHRARMELKAPDPDRKLLKQALQSAEKIIVDAKLKDDDLSHTHQQVLSVAATALLEAPATTDASFAELLSSLRKDQESAEPSLSDYEAIEQQLEVQLFRLAFHGESPEQETVLCRSVAQLIQEYQATESEPADCLATQDFAVQAFEIMCQRKQWPTALAVLHSVRQNTSPTQFRTMLQALGGRSDEISLVSDSANQNRSAIFDELRQILENQPRLKKAVETDSQLNQMAEQILSDNNPGQAQQNTD